MTSQRLSAYNNLRCALRRASRLDAETVELLRDMGEGLLLSRDGEHDEVDELEANAALALSLLVGTHHISDTDADALWQHMSACGPLRRQPPARRPAMSNTGVPWPAPDARSPSHLA